LPVDFDGWAWENVSMSLKNKIQQAIANNTKKRNRAKKLAAMKKSSNVNSKQGSTWNAFWSERIALFAALFFFSFGMGLISDGKKMYQQQLKISQRVDYKATLNPN